MRRVPLSENILLSPSYSLLIIPKAEIFLSSQMIKHITPEMLLLQQQSLNDNLLKVATEGKINAVKEAIAEGAQVNCQVMQAYFKNKANSV